MPSTDAQLAWAMSVNVVTLVANLSAQIKLQPAIDTIHLCNRFGTGEHAFIAKLPVELIKYLEESFIEQERQKQHKYYAACLRCRMGRCRPVEHLERDKIKEMYEKHVSKAPEEFTERHLDYLNAVFTETDDWDGSQVGVEEWLHEHDIHYTTTSCLTLPTTDSAKAYRPWNSKRSYVASGCTSCHADRVVPAEHGSMLHVAMPRKPSKASLARFPRAMKLLGLEVVFPERLDTTLEAQIGDAEADDETETGPDEQEQERNVAWPQLMLLTRASLNEE